MSQEEYWGVRTIGKDGRFGASRKVIIPYKLIKALGIKTGDRVKFYSVDGDVIIKHGGIKKC